MEFDELVPQENVIRISECKGNVAAQGQPLFVYRSMGVARMIFWQCIVGRRQVTTHFRTISVLGSLILIAGYGTLCAVAKAQGLNYLAIEMRDLMSATKVSTAISS